MIRLPRVLLIYLVVFGVGVMAGLFGYRWATTPSVQVVTQDRTRTVLVDRPVIETRDVVRYVTDVAEVRRLMGEAALQEHRISVLTETLARAQSAGAGPVTYVDRLVPGETRTVRDVHFADWRLQFDVRDDQASYTLTQQIEALAIVGKTAGGRPTATVRLFEVGPGATRTPMPDATTTVIAATPDRARWRTTFAVQAGVGLGPVGVVGVRWWQYGTSHAAEDATWSLFSPAARIDSTHVEPAILPISVNVGRIPRQPFRDIWVSPSVSLNLSTNKVTFGAALTATF